ncbi:unnamed protein product [Adineta steineri]|uniref:Uncharacterized protein n=2 Tax=Adineta steineri TaxID=433720 RepID=A0A814DMK5_9BILA|nr:unnamed protein product [Adineta steineri]
MMTTNPVTTTPQTERTMNQNQPNIVVPSIATGAIQTSSNSTNLPAESHEMETDTSATVTSVKLPIMIAIPVTISPPTTFTIKQSDPTIVVPSTASSAIQTSSNFTNLPTTSHEIETHTNATVTPIESPMTTITPVTGSAKRKLTINQYMQNIVVPSTAPTAIQASSNSTNLLPKSHEMETHTNATVTSAEFPIMTALPVTISPPTTFTMNQSDPTIVVPSTVSSAIETSSNSTNLSTTSHENNNHSNVIVTSTEINANKTTCDVNKTMPEKTTTEPKVDQSHLSPHSRLLMDDLFDIDLANMLFQEEILDA